jgi:coenzyme PQQ precursor peptide PqqA
VESPIPTVPAGAVPRQTGEQLMQWQTPTATDIRLGFEITMYVAAR